MSELEVIESHRMDDGTEYRAVLERDFDPQEPYDDGAWPILRVEYRHYDYVATAFNQQATPYVAKFNELFERLRILRTWERYAKIFLGATAVHEYGFNQNTDYAYIAFDPTEWRKSMEMDTPEFLEKLGEEKPLTEVEAWIENDVWGRAVQARWNPDEALEDDEGWAVMDDHDWVWGFYGQTWAEQAAKEELTGAVHDHKVVYRYYEHEKITPHQREIDAILGFLESASKGVTLCRWHNESDTPTGRNAWYPVHDSQHQRIVFEHFGIDYKKIEEERELMFKRLQMDASIQAGLSLKKSQEATDK